MDNLEQVTIEVEGKAYKVTLAVTPEEREVGLQGQENLADDQGMLFIYQEPTEVGFWMKDTPIPLDIIFIGKDEEVKMVCHGKPFDEETVFEHADILYVLEVNTGSKIQVGDDVDLTGLEKAEEDLHMDLDDDQESGESEEHKLLVLDPKGEVQMELNGGERIFSRPNTKTLVKLAKRAYASNEEKDFKALGKKVFKYIDIQNNKEEDYVEVPTDSK